MEGWERDVVMCGALLPAKTQPSPNQGGAESQGSVPLQQKEPLLHPEGIKAKDDQWEIVRHHSASSGLPYPPLMVRNRPFCESILLPSCDSTLWSIANARTGSSWTLSVPLLTKIPLCQGWPGVFLLAQGNRWERFLSLGLAQMQSPQCSLADY